MVRWGRTYMRPVCCDCRVWDWTSDAFCRSRCYQSLWTRCKQAPVYLGDMVKGERARAFNVIVSPAAERIVCADQSLFQRVLNSFSHFHLFRGSCPLTSLPLPGSLTTVNCSSLYFSNAGLADSRALGSSTVSFLMSDDVSFRSLGDIGR